MKLFRLILFASALLGLVSVARADTVLGTPVTAVGSTTHAVPNCPTLEGSVCYNTATGLTTFFIPLSSANSGVYGVTSVGGGNTAGTFSDVGSGTSNALTMNIMFSPVSLPVSSASLTFAFTDLDLSGWNDPTGFLESVQFFSATNVALTGVINSKTSSGGGTLAYTLTGDSTSQTIYFPDVSSIVVQNPFYVQLKFSSSYNTTGENTPEDVIATLNYTKAVPEPGSLLLISLGIIGAGGLRNRFRRPR